MASTTVHGESGGASEESKIGSVSHPVKQEEMSHLQAASEKKETGSAADKQLNENMSQPVAATEKKDGPVADKQSNEKKFGGLTFASLLRGIGWSGVTDIETLPESAAQAKVAEELGSGGAGVVAQAATEPAQTVPRASDAVADPTHAPHRGVIASAQEQRNESQVSLPDCRWCEYRHSPEAACEDVCRYNHGDEYRTRTGKMLPSAYARWTPCTECGHTHPTWSPHGPRPETDHTVQSDQSGDRLDSDQLSNKQATADVLAAANTAHPAPSVDPAKPTEPTESVLGKSSAFPDHGASATQAPQQSFGAFGAIAPQQQFSFGSAAQEQPQQPWQSFGAAAQQQQPQQPFGSAVQQQPQQSWQSFGAEAPQQQFSFGSAAQQQPSFGTAAQQQQPFSTYSVEGNHQYEQYEQERGVPTPQQQQYQPGRHWGRYNKNQKRHRREPYHYGSK